MSVYFVRHGQTDWNLDHRIQGRVDIELNETGRKQAAEMRDKLADKDFAAIISSPLKRAKQTADIIAELHKDMPLIEAQELSERNFGKYEGESNSPEGDYYGAWDYTRQLETGGETLLDLEKRVFPFLDKIRKEYAGKDVLLVAHAGVGLIIREFYQGKPESGNLLELPPIANGEVELLEISKEI